MRGSRKRRPGESDYLDGSFLGILREERLSASPLLKKHREAEQLNMPSPTAAVPMCVDASTRANQTDGAPQPQAFTFNRFEQYMNNNVTNQFANLAEGLKEVSQSVQSNKRKIEEQSEDIRRIKRRLEDIESGRSTAPPPSLPPMRRVPSPEYELARRSIRIWPVAGVTEDDIWGNAGDFLHQSLGLSASEIANENIVSITRLSDIAAAIGNVRNEVKLVLNSITIRDLVMSKSPNLASCVDSAGRPTAGVRLEIPNELADTFRLLNRFGARLRARHGDGTKRHIKFDDFECSLYANVKLPGDASWTRVTPEMAKADLDASLKEDMATNQRRFTTKLIPGPRERLQRPMSLSAAPPPNTTAMIAPSSLGRAASSAPRWSRPASNST